MRGTSLAVVVVALLALAGTAQATLVPISNSQFDTAALGLGVDNANPLKPGETLAEDIGGGWMTNKTVDTYPVFQNIDVIGATVYTDLGSASGNKASMRFARATNNNNRQGFLTSPMLGDAAGTVDLLIQPNSVYTLTVAVGNKNDKPFPGEVTPQYHNCIEFLFDGSLLATKPTSVPADGTWADMSLSFTTDASGVVSATTGSEGLGWNPVTTIGRNALNKALKIRLRGDTYAQGVAGQGAQIEWDNVRLDVSAAVVSTPQLSALPGTGSLLDFGTLSTSTQSTVQNVTLTNIGTAGSTINVSAADFGGTNGSLFELDTPFSSTTLTGSAGTASYGVRFKGTATPGTYTGTLTFANNSPEGNVTYTLQAIVANPHMGDANSDRKVDLQDFSLLKAYYGQTGQGWEHGNFNGDANGLVNLEDFSLLKAHYNHTGDATTSPVTAVPEPASLALLALAGLGGLVRRKR